MGPKSSVMANEYEQLMQKFNHIEQNNSQGHIFLQQKLTNRQFLLREITFNNKKDFERNKQIFNQKISVLNNNKFLVSLTRVLAKEEDHYCSTSYKIYTLFKCPHKTLNTSITQIKARNKSFSEQQLWSIFASCILSLSHLQKSAIKHNSLRSSNILISQDGYIKIYDPSALGIQNNYELLLLHRSTPHIYLSPEQCDSLEKEISSPYYHAYKTDVWTLAMIILEAGLLQYQDQCYRDECSRVHWQTLEYNINRFQQKYSSQLSHLLQFMLSKDERLRPDWIQLEQKVGKIQQTVRGSYISEINRDEVRKSQINRKSIIKQQNRGKFPSQHIIANTTYAPSTTFIQNIESNHENLRSSQNIRNQLRMNTTLIPLKPSNIENSRPLKSFFLSSNYSCMTKIDQNLIIVAEEKQTDNLQNVNSSFRRNTFDEANCREKQSIINSNHNKNDISSQIISKGYQNAFNSSAQQLNISPIIGKSFFLQASSNKQNSIEAQYVVEKYKQGSQYQGYKLNGLRHGYGKFHYQDGGLYDGEWNMNKMEGFGKLYYQSGKLAYEGQWRYDQFFGNGTLYNEYPQPKLQAFDYSNFDQIQQFWTKYEGSFVEDMKQGRGVLYLSNGQFFKGQFLNDMADGQGTYYNINGGTVNGIWVQNHLIR